MNIVVLRQQISLAWRTWWDNLNQTAGYYKRTQLLKFHCVIILPYLTSELKVMQHNNNISFVLLSYMWVVAWKTITSAACFWKTKW